MNGSQLAPDTLRRYSIGDRNKDLAYSADGSLTITLSHLQSNDKLSNWLPAPEGYFAAGMRLYEPKQAPLDNSYQLPRIEIIRWAAAITSHPLQHTVVSAAIINNKSGLQPKEL